MNGPENLDWNNLGQYDLDRLKSAKKIIEDMVRRRRTGDSDVDIETVIARNRKLGEAIRRKEPPLVVPNERDDKKMGFHHTHGVPVHERAVRMATRQRDDARNRTMLNDTGILDSAAVRLRTHSAALRAAKARDGE